MRTKTAFPWTVVSALVLVLALGTCGNRYIYPAAMVTPTLSREEAAAVIEKLAGWHGRALQLSGPQTADTSVEELPRVDSSKLLCGSSLNAQVGDLHELALFRPDLAVDAAGRLLQLTSTDFEGFTSLVKEVIEEGRLRKNWWWQVPSEISCRANTLGHLVSDTKTVDGEDKIEVVYYYNFGKGNEASGGAARAAETLFTVVMDDTMERASSVRLMDLQIEKEMKLPQMYKARHWEQEERERQRELHTKPE